jgi:hypothetical protein
MNRWWARNPWRGLPFKERRRLERLSRSGQRIEDPQDAVRIRAYVEQTKQMYRSWFWKFAFALLPWVVVPVWVVGGVVRAIQGNVVHSVWDEVVAVAYVWIFFNFKRRRRDMEHTAEVNGWAEAIP